MRALDEWTDGSELTIAGPVYCSVIGKMRQDGVVAVHCGTSKVKVVIDRHREGAYNRACSWGNRSLEVF